MANALCDNLQPHTREAVKPRTAKTLQASNRNEDPKTELLNNTLPIPTGPKHPKTVKAIARLVAIESIGGVHELLGALSRLPRESVRFCRKM